MKLTKQTQFFEGELSNGAKFSLDLIKSGNDWLFGVKISDKPLFFTSSNDFKGVSLFDVQNEVALQLEALGIPGEDVKHFMNQLNKVM